MIHLGSEKLLRVISQALLIKAKLPAEDLGLHFLDHFDVLNAFIIREIEGMLLKFDHL